MSYAMANDIDNEFSYDTIPKQCRATLKRMATIKFKSGKDEYEITPFGFCKAYGCNDLKGKDQSILILSKNNLFYSYVKEIPVKLYEMMKMEAGGDDEIIKRLTRNKEAIPLKDPKKYLFEKYLPSEIYEDSDVVYSMLSFPSDSETSSQIESERYYHYPVFEDCMLSEITPFIKLTHKGRWVIIEGLRSGQCSICGASAVFELSNPDSGCYKPLVKINEIDEYIMRKRPYRMVDNKRIPFKMKVARLHENKCAKNDLKTMP